MLFAKRLQDLAVKSHVNDLIFNYIGTPQNGGEELTMNHLSIQPILFLYFIQLGLVP